MISSATPFLDRLNSPLMGGIFALLMERVAPTQGGTASTDLVAPVQDELAVQLVEGGAALADTLHQLPVDPEEIDSREWEHLLGALNHSLATHLLVGRVLPKLKVPSTLLAEQVLTSHARVIEVGAGVLRMWVVHRPEVLDSLSPEVAERVLTFRIPWWAYLRSMWNLFWSAIRHPLSETTIDLSTGRVLYHT